MFYGSFARNVVMAFMKRREKGVSQGHDQKQLFSTLFLEKDKKNMKLSLIGLFSQNIEFHRSSFHIVPYSNLQFWRRRICHINLWHLWTLQQARERRTSLNDRCLEYQISQGKWRVRSLVRHSGPFLLSFQLCFTPRFFQAMDKSLWVLRGEREGWTECADRRCAPVAGRWQPLNVTYNNYAITTHRCTKPHMRAARAMKAENILHASPS